MLVPGSLVFAHPAEGAGRPVDYTQWWKWQPGANWRHPTGPASDIEGKHDHPVVQVSWNDAVAYATWAGKRLPTETEWEYTARGGLDGQSFAWGAELHPEGCEMANVWQGTFPVQHRSTDGFLTTAPVASFPANGYGLYDMAGNVWEWCADWYRPDTYSLRAHRIAVDPAGPDDSFDPDEPTVPKRVTRGGSFLCSENYCTGYRPSARMKTSPDTGLPHTGFRCVVDPAMLAATEDK